MNDTKLKIVNKAIELFNRDGYDNVSVSRICEECGLTKGAFYNYFDNKIDVLPAYFYANINSDDELFLRLFREEDPLEQIWLIIKPTVDLGIKMGPVTMKYSWFYNIENDNIFSVAFKDYPGFGLSNTKMMIEIIEKGQKSGRLRSDLNPDELFQLYFDAFNGISVRWVASKGSFDVSEAMYNALKSILLK